MKWLAIVWATWFAWIPVTFFFGRVFCRYVCPLGLSQSLVGFALRPKSNVRRVCSRLPRTRLQRCVNIALLVAYLALPVGQYLHPWGIFGRVLVLFAPGIAFFAGVLLLSAFGKGRIWCNWVCPLGTIFDVAAKFALRGDRIGRGCGNCRACFPEAPARDAGTCSCGGDGLTRRETLKGVAVIAAAEKLTDGGFADVSVHSRPARAALPLPPGAGSEMRFSNLCVGCGLCAAKCPGGCLVPSTSLLSLGKPEMDFRKGYCLVGCVKCGDVCPTAAIRRLDADDRPKLRMGLAKVRKELCMRSKAGEKCRACARKCPVGAVKIENGFPSVDPAKCIGCGACEHVCPARPEPAIFVEGYERQSETTGKATVR